MTRKIVVLSLAAVVPVFLLAMPASAQDRANGGGGGAASHGGGSGNGGGTATPRTTATGDRSPRTIDGGTPQYSRPRDGREAIGTAVPRGPTTDRGGTATFVPAGYYGGLFGYGFYDPYSYYGGYYGGYYDPWYGSYPSYGQTTYTSGNDEGSLRLKIRPREAEVYVDGYYVGIVDDFDGIFQRLHVETGSHRIEVRAPGYEPLTFEVRITSDHTTTYQGELKKIQ